MSKDKVGFIGVGEMGKPMARGLIEKGIDTVVYDIREEPVKELERLGARIARSPREIGALCDIVIIMVVDAAQAELVILGEEGVLTSAKKGSVIAVMSTVDPLFCERAARIAGEKGVGFLDAPVSGGQKGAEAHTLTLMVGGERHLLERCRYVFEAMASNIFHIGGVGTGQAIKIANNSIVHAILIGTAGGIALAARAGVRVERFIEIIQTTKAKNCVAQNWEFWRNKGRPEGKASLYITCKDMRFALDLTKAYGLSLPLVEAIAKLDIAKIIACTEELQPKVQSTE